MSETIIRICIWLTLWIIVKGIFYRFFERGESYVKNPLRTSIYFLGASCVVYLLFSSEVVPFLSTITFKSRIILLFFLLGAFLYYKLFDAYLHLRGVKRHHLLLAQISQKYLFSKLFDVLFQQLEIIVLVSLLQSLNVSFNVIVCIFAILFSLLHIPLIKLKGRNFGIYFTLSAVISAFVFPYYILFVPGGVLYSFMIHITFYLFSGVIANGVSHYRTLRAEKSTYDVK